MAIINKNDLKQLSNSTYIDNTQGLIRPQDVRFFNETLIDSIVDETGYAIDSGSWNAALLALTQSVTNITSLTGSFVTNDQTASMSVATASYVDLRGDGIVVNYGNGWIELTGSQGGGSQVYIDSTPPSLSLPTGSLWFDSVNGILSVLYGDSDGNQWVEANYGGTLATASFAQTASYFITSSVTSASHATSASWSPIPKTVPTASYFLTSSVTSASRAELAGEALWYYTASVTNATYASTASYAQRINVTGSGVLINWDGEQLQLTGSNGGTQVFQGDTAPTSAEVTTGSLWYNTTNGGLYVMYVDQDSSQWVSVNAIGPVASASYARSSSLAATASYINVTGSGVIANWFGSQLQLTGSKDSQVIVSDTPPVGVEEGQQWFNSDSTTMFVYYGGVWVGVSASGPVVSASYSDSASYSQTSSMAYYAQTGGNQNLQSVTSFGNTTSQSIDIRDRIIVNITGSGTLTQGKSVEARGDFSHAQGYDTWAGGDYSHAEGDSTSAYGESSHAEGSGTVTIDAFSHAEGEGSVADGVGSHAEGYGTRTVGRGSHAEGTFTLAEGPYSHAEGENTWAIGRSSNASGLGTVTQGIASNTEGRYTNAREDYQSVVGQWNIPLDGTDKQGWFIIGDGNGQPGDPNELHNLFMAGDGRIIISGTLDVEGGIIDVVGDGITVNWSGSQLQLTASSVPLDYGPGIIGDPINLNAFSASVRSVNGVFPIDGNINTSLTNVIVGLSGSLIQSSSGTVTASLEEGTVWVVAGEVAPNEASNGQSYIWDGQNPGQWRPLANNEVDTLQSVTSRGNRTTTSVIIGDATSTATGANSLSIGITAIASGQQSLAGGIVTSATNRWSFAYGEANTATGQSSVAMNAYTTANGAYSFAQGHSTQANGLDSHAEGAYSTAIGAGSHAEGGRYIPSDPGGNFAGGTAIGNSSHAEGRQTTSVGVGSHAEGYGSIANGIYAHAEGLNTTANGNYSHTEGYLTFTTYDQSHAEGYRTTTIGVTSHAEGDRTTAAGNNSHAEGVLSIATGNGAHSEGGASNIVLFGGIAVGAGSHAEGSTAVSNGVASHAEGESSVANGTYSHAEGSNTTANGISSHTQGLHTIANGNYQDVVGQFNKPFNSSSAFIVGNGTSNASRSNLIEAFGNTINLNGTVLVNGSPIGGSTVSASYATTASYAITSSYVSGAVMFTSDTYASVPSVTNIVSLTLAEYNAIGTKNPNVLYIVKQ